MIRDAIQREQEKKDQEKARRYAILFLILMLLILFLPFVSGKLQTEQKFEKVITIQFEEEFFEQQAASAKSSTKAASAQIESPVQEEAPEAKPEQPEPEPEKVKPQPIPEPVPVTPAVHTPIITSSEPELAITTSPITLPDISEDAQVEAVSEEVTEVMEEVSEATIGAIADFFGKSKTSTASSGKKSDAPVGGKPSDGGEGDSGSSASGKSNTDGQGNSGNAESGFDGKITREVVYRANLDDVIKQSGTISVSICINRDGKVIFAKANKKKSTIKDPYLLKKAERTISKYKYAKDYSVAERQCGQFSFVVKMQN